MARMEDDGGGIFDTSERGQIGEDQQVLSGPRQVHSSEGEIHFSPAKFAAARRAEHGTAKVPEVVAEMGGASPSMCASSRWGLGPNAIRN